MKTTVVFLAISILFLSGPAHADLINGGFETGDFTGWTVLLPPAFPPADGYQRWLNQPEGQANVVSSQRVYDYNTFPTYFPVDGQYFAEISSALYPALAGGPVITSLSQEIYLRKGDYLSGSAAFDNHNWYYGGDEAWVGIYEDGTEIATPWYAYSSSLSMGQGHLGYVSGYGNLPTAWNTASPWVNWGWTAPEDGVYTLELAQQSVVPGGADSFASTVLFDNISVPEPSTVLLLGFGIIGVAGLRKKFR